MKYMALALLSTASIASAAIHVDLNVLVREHNIESTVKRSITVNEGETNEFSFDDYQVTMVMQCCGDNKIKGNFKVTKGEEIISNPTVVSESGQEACVEIKDQQSSDTVKVSFVAHEEK
jgi:hypothetical protein